MNKRPGGPPGSGTDIYRVTLLSKTAAAELRRRATIAGPRFRKQEADQAATDILELLAGGRLLLITEDMIAAAAWLQEARALCPNEQAQRGLDQLIAALWTTGL